MTLKYCSQCGQPLQLTIPDGDNRPRFVCPNCGAIHYQNPRIIASCLAHWEDKVLWIRRARDPRHGFWHIPAGFMECDESLHEAAIRELQEEAGVSIDKDQLTLYTVGTLLFTNQVYVVFRAPLASPIIQAGIEALEADLFAEHEVPWEQLAFPVIKDLFRRFYHELQSGSFSLYMGEFRRQDNRLFEIVEGLR